MGIAFQVEEDDGLPGVVCSDCDKRLHSWRAFYDRAHQTQSQLGPTLEPTVPDISTNVRKHFLLKQQLINLIFDLCRLNS